MSILVRFAILCAIVAASSSAEAQVRKSDEKRVAFEFDSVPWSKVINWYVEFSALPYVSVTRPPPGSFTFRGPQGRKYSLAEITDILNEGLGQQKYALVRRDRSFTIVPADEPVPRELVPRVSPADLDKWGNNELVSVVVSLKTQVAEDFAPQVKKILGPFGQVVVLAPSNQLVLEDRAGTLRRLLQIINDVENPQREQAATLAHKCVYVRAQVAAKLLSTLLGDAKSTPVANAPGSARDRPHYITYDEASNTIFFSGPPDKVAQARRFLTTFDQPQRPGQRPLTTNAPATTEFIGLGISEAAPLAKTLQTLFADVKPPVYIEADSLRNGLVVSGTADQVADLNRVVRDLDNPAGAPGTLTIQLPGGKAAPLARSLQDLLQRMGHKNPIQIIGPGIP